MIDFFLQFQATPAESNAAVNMKGASLQEREELKMALVSAQESGAVQVLLECCLPNKEEKVRGLHFTCYRHHHGKGTALLVVDNLTATIWLCIIHVQSNLS